MSEPENAAVQKAEELIAEYENLHGRITPDGRLSERYDLHKQWNTTSFPNAANAGCYFIFGRDGTLLYVGKASLGSTVGRRLSTYFHWNTDDEVLAHSHDGWEDSQPSFVRTIPVLKAYQAASLEEFLIDRLQPSHNTRK